jgi:hypothetical protein
MCWVSCVHKSRSNSLLTVTAVVPEMLLTFSDVCEINKEGNEGPSVIEVKC